VPTPGSAVLDVLYRGNDLLVINKPAGVALFADRSGAANLWDAIKQHLGATPALPVHRLDKGTSGVLLIALTAARQAQLNRAFQARAIAKYYLARVAGRLEVRGTAVIDLPLTRGRKSRYRVAGPRAAITRAGERFQLGSATRDGLDSLTRVRVLGHTEHHTLVALAPTTGRTHQLRVHLAWIGHAIAGDHLYGRPDDPAQQWPRLALHCHRVRLPDAGGVYWASVPAGL
jgi:tRNA pseudouridine32 synthase/23S rRNA pseudouridine746 synthase/23S rRNA pseudouridine1911/1915/1917 synthase